ncbi:alanyl-tRNA synthetase [Vibrio maritimus]|uniref:Alanine--tRNA ligase n=1 Tax=Vibrio maritimus TaxID=990268 RepID=A0A090RVM3_9VIBR|nr:alanyl-tRNA synthetase [Vibrio maritimus]
MGDTGPCGPCTEIFYDHGEHIWGGRPGTPEEDGDRFIEIWNNVFMQFNRHADGTMEPLPKPSVDTGMGIERISAIMQGVHSNYEIDVFQTLIKAAAEVIGYKDLSNQSLRVIADHIRSCSFLIVDGVMPSNEGRGYVLRRIIRRAVRHGNKLGAQGAFFYKLVGTLASVMGTAGEELKKQQAVVEKVLRIEEENFGRTLERGMTILTEALDNLGDEKVLDGETVFKLYDTYGFPADLTNDVARERELLSMKKVLRRQWKLSANVRVKLASLVLITMPRLKLILILNSVVTQAQKAAAQWQLCLLKAMKWKHSLLATKRLWFLKRHRSTQSRAVNVVTLAF